jgi:hypothetical protein
MCGWYYARVIDGRISAAEAPETCKFVAEQESAVCESFGVTEICVEGNTFTVTFSGYVFTSIGVLDTYAEFEACISEAFRLAGTTDISYVFGKLSGFGGAFTGDDRTYCAYRPFQN